MAIKHAFEIKAPTTFKDLYAGDFFQFSRPGSREDVMQKVKWFITGQGYQIGFISITGGSDGAGMGYEYTMDEEPVTRLCPHGNLQFEVC